MTMTCRTTLLFLAILMLAGSKLAFAQPGPHGFRGGPGGERFAKAIEENAERLGLSEQTMADVSAIVAEGREKEERLHDELRAARHKLRMLLSGKEPNDEAVMKQAERVGAIETDALKHRLRTLLRLRPLLTDAQLEALRGLHHERFEPVREACRAEIEALCPEGPRGRGIGRCLRRHQEELSDACAAAFEAFRPRHHRRRGP